MTKKLSCLFIGLIWTFHFLTGCTPAKPEFLEIPAPTPTLTSAKQTTFTYAVGADIGNVINPLTVGDRWGLMICHLLYSPIYFINPDGSVDYILAESMEVADDGLSYTLKLKNSLKWSDGAPLTADDILFTYETVNSHTKNLYIDDKPIQLEKKDEHTVVFRLPSVSASAFEMLSTQISILPKHIFESRNSFDVNISQESIVGCGPYILEEYKPGESFRFRKNPHYANGEAFIETIIYRIIEDNDAASLALQKGEIDAWIALPNFLAPFENNNLFTIHNYSEGRIAYLRLNTKTPNMEDKNYREGILLALDRNEIMKAAYSNENFYRIGYSFLPYNNSYYSEEVEQWTQNIEKAKEKTATGSKTLTLCYIEEDPAQTAQAIAIQTQLKAIGIDLRLIGLPLMDYVKATDDKNNREHDMFLSGYIMGIDPDIFASLFVSTKINIVHYDNKEIDALFAKANRILEPGERNEIYLEIQRKVSEEAIFYPFGSNLRTLVLSPKIGGVEDAKLVPIYTFGSPSRLKFK